MTSMLRLLLLCSLALSACVVDADWEEFELDRSPFANAWVDRADASFSVLLADGYVCPDGLQARIHLVEPNTPASATGPRPLALLLHGRPFDEVRADGLHPFDEDRLQASWASRQVESALGMESALGTSARGDGAWVAALLGRGFAVAAPGNCFGDLWHGRGDNAYEERFLRYGAWLMNETISIVGRRPDISAETLVVVGLGEGGRGIVELAADGAPMDGVIVDSSPDWMSPLIAQPSVNQLEIETLSAIYDGELSGIADPATRLEALRVALERDSLVSAVNARGFRVPIVYAWSSLDERIPSEQARPAADAISVSYPPTDAVVLDWALSDHAPSNRDLTEAQARLDWLLARIGAP